VHVEKKKENEKMTTTTNHEVIEAMPVMPPANGIHKRSNLVSASDKPIEDMTPLERVERYETLIADELHKVKNDLATDLNNVIGALKSLCAHGQNNVLSDPSFEEPVKYLQLQLNPHFGAASPQQPDSATKSKSTRVDAKVRQLLEEKGALTEHEIIQSLPDYRLERIQSTLRNRSVGKKACFKFENNKWELKQ
jgi:hypothetical protein